MKKMVIAAGTGFLGTVLIDFFKESYQEIVVLTRRKSERKNNIQFVHWNANSLTGWEEVLENADVLINLAGKSVDCRYTPENKAAILSSRIDSTRVLNEAVLQCKNPPKHFINSSTATIYRHSEDKQMDEYSGEIGDDFSMNVGKSWEKAFYDVQTDKTLKTAVRTSIVLGKNGGAFIPLKRLTQLGFGGKNGNGNQFVSWIHELDFARAIAFIIDNNITGSVNVVSPRPVRNVDSMRKLRKAVGIPFGIPVSITLLQIGAKIIQTEPELVLKSRNVIPKRLTENGFTFGYQDLEKAFKNLLS